MTYFIFIKSKKVSIRFTILVAIPFTIRFLILFANMFAISSAVRIAIMIGMLFLKMGPVMNQESYTSTITYSFLSHLLLRAAT